MGKGFGDLFSESWKEYKFNFKVFLKLFLLLYIIPITILLTATTFFYTDFSGTSLTKNFVQSLPIIFLYLLFIIIYFIMQISFLYVAVFNQRKIKFTLGKAIKGGLSFFWKYIGLSLLIFICLVPLVLLPITLGFILWNYTNNPFIFMLVIPLLFLLFIPGLIFAIYWMFSVYILMRENTGLWESMKRSKIIVKKRWWKVFGYGLLFGIIMALISIPFGIPKFIIEFFTTFYSLSGGTLGSGMLILIIVAGIINSFSALITSPWTILFFKNLYLDLRNNLEPKK